MNSDPLGPRTARTIIGGARSIEGKDVHVRAAKANSARETFPSFRC